MDATRTIEIADPKFWRGFGLESCPDFSGLTVLEIGCGEGRRLIEAAACGATRVVGVDPMAASIESARGRIKDRDDIRPRVTLFNGTLDALPADTFDVILSEDTLEHVRDAPALLAAIAARLKPGGRCYLGFGPLYHAPDGDHGWLRAQLPFWPRFAWPWGHLLFESYAFRKLSIVHGRKIDQTVDWPYLTLNRLTISDYKSIFARSGLRIASLRANDVTSAKGHLIAALARLPGLAKYCTLNLFAILAKD